MVCCLMYASIAERAFCSSGPFTIIPIMPSAAKTAGATARTIDKASFLIFAFFTDVDERRRQLIAFKRRCQTSLFEEEPHERNVRRGRNRRSEERRVGKECRSRW